MDHAPNNEPSSSETTADNGDEPSAAHFREAARLAAARVRAAMAGMPDETEKSDEPAPLKPPSAKAMEAVARKRARSLAGRAERDTTTPDAKSGKKSINQRINAANDKAAALLPEIDERLETGARMLRAFESQIERLERAARNAEEASTGNGGDREAHEQSVEALEARFNNAREQAEASTLGLETINSESTTTAEALSNGLETATTVKNLLETTIKDLAEEAERRSNEVKAMLTRAEEVVSTLDQQLSRATEVEQAIQAGLERSEATARKIETLVDDRINQARANAEQVERASQAALGSVREHVARELAGISSALLQQTAKETPTTTPAITTPATTTPATTTPATTTPAAESEAIEPPVIEVDRPSTTVQTPPDASSVTGQISHGTLSIDEAAIKQPDQRF
jgi:methyl-accepting chemotaxis protein